MRTTTHSVAILGVALAVLALVACAGREDAPRPGTAAAPATAAAGGPDRARAQGAGGPAGAQGPVPVVLAPAVESSFSTAIEAVGTAMAREAVDITAKVSNTVSRIAFEEGQRVERGTVLVELESAEVVAELAGAESALAESRRQYERSRDLATRQLLSDAQLDQVDAALKAAEARAAAARARRANNVIRAPFGGRTGFRRVSVGGLVNPGTVITTLDDISIIKLEFTIPEAQMFLVEKGSPVEASTVGLPGRTFSGVLSAIDARVDPVSRSIRVRAELPNADGTLRPGMFMTVNLRGRTSKAVVVPEAAIVPEQGRTFVYVVDDASLAKRREVQVGRRRVGEVEIAAGLSAGERVVVDGTVGVRDGGPVRIVDPGGAPVGASGEAAARADR
jgi:membrane fusion protein (multidrug efflux system)